MDTKIEQNLIAKLRALAPEQISQVEDFVDFINAKRLRQAAFDRLLSVAPAIEAMNLSPLTDDDIDAEVASARAELNAQYASQEQRANRL
jgi:hypothetical protein